MKTRAAIGLAFVISFAAPATAASDAAKIEAFFKPYAATNNLSGSILIIRGGSPVFSRSFGYADQAKHIPNRSDTRFHIASLSILFTSTAVLRLIDQSKLSFDTPVSEIVAGVPNGNKITIRNLLLQNSNLPDSNDDLPNYDDLLKVHNTPRSLVDAVETLPPHGDPGGESQREEHSGQNLLALIIEKKTGLPFAQAMQRLVFEPFGMHDSGIDDDGPIAGPVARGYVPSGTFGLTNAQPIHWSAKPGNGSVYSTVADEWKWLQGVTRGRLLSESSRSAILGTEDGFGWYRSKLNSGRLGERTMLSNGRGPGFSSFLEYLPKSDVAIIVLSNIEHDQNPVIIPEAAAMVMGKSYQAFDYAPVPVALVGKASGNFTFGPDFYRPSATLKLASDRNGVTLHWPDHPVAPLLPIARDKFMDRYYWTVATIVRDANGNPVELDYGKFRGLRASKETK